jgi:hypothetical protein
MSHLLDVVSLTCLGFPKEESWVKVRHALVDNPQSSHSIPYPTFTSRKLITFTRATLNYHSPSFIHCIILSERLEVAGSFKLSSGDARLSTAQALQPLSLCNQRTTNHSTCTTNNWRNLWKNGFKFGSGLIKRRTPAGEAV